MGNVPGAERTVGGRRRRRRRSGDAAKKTYEPFPLSSASRKVSAFTLPQLTAEWSPKILRNCLETEICHAITFSSRGASPSAKERLQLWTNDFESPLGTAQSEPSAAFSARRREPMGAPPFNGPLTSHKRRCTAFIQRVKTRLREQTPVAKGSQGVGSRNLAFSRQLDYCKGDANIVANLSHCRWDCRFAVSHFKKDDEFSSISREGKSECEIANWAPLFRLPAVSSSPLSPSLPTWELPASLAPALSCPAPLLTLSLSPFEPRRFSEISNEFPFEALRQLQHGGIA